MRTSFAMLSGSTRPEATWFGIMSTTTPYPRFFQFKMIIIMILII